ncbi:MAG: hypothetical protein Q4D29_11625, partial [Lachnospiraceae bacterium]|nr:hypothetical protein [Lachnospiraceae bacterium]
MRKKASLTIELSLLMPGIMSAIIIIIFASYYYHDRCVIECAAYSSVLKESQMCSDRCAVDIFDDCIEDKLLGVWSLSTLETCNEETVTIQVKGNMKCFNGMLLRY